MLHPLATACQLFSMSQSCSRRRKMPGNVAIATHTEVRLVYDVRAITMDLLELTTILQDPSSATRRLLNVWSEVPLLLMLDVDWDRGPLVLIGQSDRMMWPLLPPGSLLQLNSKVRTIADGVWTEFDRPIYLIEVKGRFCCCHAQRRGETLRLISHSESTERPSISVPFKEARVRGRLNPIFRPLATRGNLAGRAVYRQRR